MNSRIYPKDVFDKQVKILNKILKINKNDIRMSKIKRIFNG
jgi:hypothetical protein